MRTFVAVELAPELRIEIERLRDRLRKVGANVKWVASQNTHLTLKFIGDIPDNSVEQAIEIVSKACAGASPFEFRIAGAGRFPPHSGRLAVIWAGVDDPGDNLKNLHTQLDEAMAAIGVDREDKPFSGHITLGRLRKPDKVKELIAAIDSLHNAAIGTQSVKQLVLFKSDLTPLGPVYTPLAEIPLGETTTSE